MSNDKDMYPLWSSHGHGRKTHIADDDCNSFCHVEKRHPELVFDLGEPINEDIMTWAGHNADDFCCRRCLAAAVKYERQ